HQTHPYLLHLLHRLPCRRACILSSLPPSLFVFSHLLSLHGSAPPEIYTLSLHDALPICRWPRQRRGRPPGRRSCSCSWRRSPGRSEEHTSELQSRFDLVCRLLLEKKNRNSHHGKCT